MNKHKLERDQKRTRDYSAVIYTIDPLNLI